MHTPIGPRRNAHAKSTLWYNSSDLLYEHFVSSAYKQIVFTLVGWADSFFGFNLNCTGCAVFTPSTGYTAAASLIIANDSHKLHRISAFLSFMWRESEWERERERTLIFNFQWWSNKTSNKMSNDNVSSEALFFLLSFGFICELTKRWNYLFVLYWNETELCYAYDERIARTGATFYTIVRSLLEWRKCCQTPINCCSNTCNARVWVAFLRYDESSKRMIDKLNWVSAVYNQWVYNVHTCIYVPDLMMICHAC